MIGVMKRAWRMLGKMVPAAVTLAMGVAFWAGIEHTKATLVGWVLMMTVVGMAAGVVAGARGEIGNRKWEIEKRRYPVAGMGGGMAVAGVIFLLFICLCVSYAGIWGGARAGAVVGAWVMLWGAVAWGLRRWGTGVSVGVAMGLAGLCMALPVGAMPAVRAAHAGSGWLRGMVEVVAHACPFFPALSALGPEVRVDWGVLAGMYQWSGLGQEVPLGLPGAWGCAALYGVLAAGICAAGWFRNR
jgi:hypothetical protein